MGFKCPSGNQTESDITRTKGNYKNSVLCDVPILETLYFVCIPIWQGTNKSLISVSLFHSCNYEQNVCTCVSIFN